MHIQIIKKFILKMMRKIQSKAIESFLIYLNYTVFYFKYL